MTFKFFRAAVATASFLGALGLLVPGGVLSQADPSTTPTPAARGPKSKMAHVRFLNLLPLNSGILNFFGPGGTEGQPLMVAPPSNLYAPYLDLPPVRTTFRVFRPDNRQTELKSVDAPLRVDGYYTVLMHPQAEGQPALECLDENPDPNAPPSNRLTIMQFFPGAQVVITAGGQQRTNPLAYGQTQTLTALPDGTLPLSMVATMSAGGPPRSLNMDVSFDRHRHATIYIVRDPYNRLRPRLMNDGLPRAEEDAAALLRKAANSSPIPPR